jgi:hypothetical protein
MNMKMYLSRDLNWQIAVCEPRDITMLLPYRTSKKFVTTIPAVGLFSRYSWTAGARFPGEARDFLFFATSRPALRPILPHTQWVTGALSPGVKRLGREADHSPPSTTEVKKSGAMPPPHTSSRSGVTSSS